MENIRKRYAFYLGQFFISWVTLAGIIISSAFWHTTKNLFKNDEIHLGMSGLIFLMVLFLTPIIVIIFHKKRGTLKEYDIRMIQIYLDELEVYAREHDFKNESQVETAWNEYTRLQKFAKKVSCLQDMRTTFFAMKTLLEEKMGGYAFGDK